MILWFINFIIKKSFRNFIEILRNLNVNNYRIYKRIRKNYLKVLEYILISMIIL